MAGAGSAPHGHRLGARRRPRDRRRRGRDLEPAARGQHRRRARRPALDLRRLGPRAVRDQQRPPVWSPTPRTPRRTSSSAPSSTIPPLGDEVRVTVIAAGFDGGLPPARRATTKTADKPAEAAAAAAEPVIGSTRSTSPRSRTSPSRAAHHRLRRQRRRGRPRRPRLPQVVDCFPWLRPDPHGVRPQSRPGTSPRTGRSGQRGARRSRPGGFCWPAYAGGARDVGRRRGCGEFGGASQPQPQGFCAGRRTRVALATWGEAAAGSSAVRVSPSPGSVCWPAARGWRSRRGGGRGCGEPGGAGQPQPWGVCWRRTRAALATWGRARLRGRGWLCLRVARSVWGRRIGERTRLRPRLARARGPCPTVLVLTGVRGRAEGARASGSTCRGLRPGAPVMPSRVEIGRRLAVSLQDAGLPSGGVR